MKRKENKKKINAPTFEPRPAKSYFIANGRFSHSGSHILYNVQLYYYSQILPNQGRMLVIGFGLTGVWRMHHMDFTSCDEDVYLELIKESHVFQPENHGELTEGKLHHIIEVLVSCNYVEHK